MSSRAPSGANPDVLQPFGPARNASLNPTAAYGPRSSERSDMAPFEGHGRKPYETDPTCPPRALLQQQDSLENRHASPMANPQADSRVLPSWFYPQQQQQQQTPPLGTPGWEGDIRSRPDQEESGNSLYAEYDISNAANDLLSFTSQHNGVRNE